MNRFKNEVKKGISIGIKKASEALGKPESEILREMSSDKRFLRMLRCADCSIDDLLKEE